MFCESGSIAPIRREARQGERCRGLTTATVTTNKRQILEHASMCPHLGLGLTIHNTKYV